MKAALNTCLGKLFKDLNGNPAAKLISFTPSSRGKNGSAKVEYTDPSNSRFDGSVAFRVTNDVKSYSFARLKSLGQGEGVGYTNPNSPSVNYTISDRGSHHSGVNRELENLIGGYMSTQIHELGNSIWYITGNYIGSRNPDSDSGYPLASCVTDELRKK